MRCLGASPRSGNDESTKLQSLNLIYDARAPERVFVLKDWSPSRFSVSFSSSSQKRSLAAGKLNFLIFHLHSVFCTSISVVTKTCIKNQIDIPSTKHRRNL